MQAELDDWLVSVERGSKRRARIERLIMAKGLMKPVTLAQRFALKTQEIGFVATVALVRGRLARMRGGQ